MPTINNPDGTYADVTDEHLLKTYTISRSVESHSNIAHEGAYSVVYGVNPSAAGDCFFYIKNTDDEDLVVEGFSYTSSAAEEIYIEIANTGTAVATAGISMTPKNLNAGSGKTADVTCYSNISDGAVDITGLTTGREVDRIWITAAADNKWYNFEQDIILSKNQTFSMWCVGGDTLLRGVVLFHFDDEE